MRTMVLLLASFVALVPRGHAQERPEQPAAPVHCDPKYVSPSSAGEDGDRFGGLKRVMRACAAEWQKLNSDMEEGLPKIGLCGPQFQIQFDRVQQAFKNAMEAKNNYYKSWENSVREDAKRSGRFAALQKVRIQEIQTELDQAEDELKALTSRRTALMESDPEKLKAAIAALDKLILTTTDTRDNFIEAMRNVREAGATAEDAQKNQADLLAKLTAQLTNIQSEETLWVAYYDARLGRKELMCPAVVDMETATHPGQKKR